MAFSSSDVARCHTSVTGSLLLILEHKTMLHLRITTNNNSITDNSYILTRFSRVESRARRFIKSDVPETWGQSQSPKRRIL
jgi:hypothetical protein